MYEVELKLRADHSRLRERLAAVGADPVGVVEQADTYYDHPARAFGETDEALRVRRETADGETTAVLTYKGPLFEEASKTREEFETRLGDADTMADILGELGFEAAVTVEKTRERFEHGRYTVTLDSVAGLGEFLEVEAEAEAERVDPVREGAVELLSELGLDADDQIRTSYLGLLLESESG